MSRNQRLDRLEQAMPEPASTGGCRQCTPDPTYRQQLDWARAMRDAAKAQAEPVPCASCGAAPDLERYRWWLANWARERGS
jgi:hypothetical protein